MAFETVTNPSARSDAKFLRVSATGFSANKRLAGAAALWASAVWSRAGLPPVELKRLTRTSLVSS